MDLGEQVFIGHPDRFADNIAETALGFFSDDDNVSVEVMLYRDTVLVLVESSSLLKKTGLRYLEHGIKDRFIYLYPQTPLKHLFGLPKIKIINLKQSSELRKTKGFSDNSIATGYYNKLTDSSISNGQKIANTIALVHKYNYNEIQRELSSDGKVLIAEGTAYISQGVYELGGSKDFWEKECKKLGLKCMLKEYKIIGPYSDIGLTGRKLVCQGPGPGIPIGGGSYYGKDIEKIDRKGADYAHWLARQIGLEEERDIVVTIAFVMGGTEPIVTEDRFKEYIKKYSFSKYLSEF